ncbi:ABC transporter ATP-binding protein [Streptococcus ovuberis]|uniref:ABC transporter ATP-binding protein n=1 Tax=Streptococcus ovuberis TaxID=1936207 RepID=A0A7X6MWR1_9STRE|nr:ABC transporter ATP-binding protein [Streptococcus ovuberis]NKZ19326.1 ABC transporter ATP-binding protein [Streptococcus ovuberis]
MQLHLNHIGKSFQGTEVLKDCHHSFSSGQIIGLLGRNGAGKTTLFNLINHELEADQGEILLERDGETRPIQVGDVGMVFAENYLPDFLTGYEFIQFFLDLHGDSSSLTPDEYLDMVSISEEDRHRIIKGYSSGMQSKLSLLTVFIMQPPVILLDEPLTSVDVVIGIELKKLLKTLKEGRVILLSTHILQLAMDLCDQVVLLRDGVLSSLDVSTQDPDFEARLLAEFKGDHYAEG